MNLRFAIGRRLNCRRLALTAAILVLPACGRSRDRPPDKRSFICQAPPPSKRESFGSEMRAAMRRMHDGMDVGYSGDSDRDFATMMIPHHQGAVDMALAELRFGRHEQLRRLAAGIIVEQRSEIASMAQILAETGVPRGAPSALPQARIARQPGE